MRDQLTRGIAALALGISLMLPAAQAQSAPPLMPCRVEGFRNDVQCGSIQRPLSPASPQGTQIEVQFVVLPAIARNKHDDAIFFFAGGPGQSAIKIAPQIVSAYARLNARRDVVFIDQRGTGKSAPLECKPTDEDRRASIADFIDESRFVKRLLTCKEKLVALPYGKDGGLSFFHTAIALQDADAVRAMLGYSKINVMGGSYGSRAALEYMRQYPARVRRAVIDGLAPPDMVLPESFGPDNQAAFELMLGACEKDAACSKRYPQLRGKFEALIASLPKSVNAINPLTGRNESFTLTANAVASAIRLPLYMPGLTSALPYALAEASEQNYTPLLGISGGMGGSAEDMAYGMHFSVVCAEDYPRMRGAHSSKPTLFGASFGSFYQQLCPQWFGSTKPTVPEAFYAMPPVKFPTLVLSGGADPVTPPRHGERVAKALGANAKHIVAPEVGHIVMFQGCARDMVSKFIDASDDTEAMKLDEACIARLSKIPRPPTYSPHIFSNLQQNNRANDNISKGVQ